MIEIAEILEKKKFIHSAKSFIILDRVLSLLNKKQTLKAGEYIFKEEKNLWEVYRKIAQGESEIIMIRIRTIEGAPNFRMSAEIAEKFENISEENFLKLADEKEGFLYPDTYHFSPYAEAELIIETMYRNFNQKIEPYLEYIKNSEKTLKEIIIIASLIENEAGGETTKTKRHVSGIIYNRLEINKLLQIDAVFSYIFGYHIHRVLYRHLRVDSPYNVYKHHGLPPSPIGNPSILSIRAAIFPLETDNLYYLTGLDGIFYYAKTGEQHLRNVKLHR